MAILMAFQSSEEMEVLGLTTIFGIVSTGGATRNALLPCEIAGCSGIPVAEGSPEPLKEESHVLLTWFTARVVWETHFCLLQKLIRLRKVRQRRSLNFQVIKRDSSFSSKVKKVVILGGAFFAMGNVNPAAETNIYGDPEAAGIVFTSGADIVVVGIYITTQIKLTDEDLLEIRQSKGRYAQVFGEMCKSYTLGIGM